VKYAELIATTAMIAAASDITADGAAAPCRIVRIVA
jgi:hypothetical protein